MKIFVAQLNPTIGDLQGNCRKIVAALDAGRKKGADIVLFGEMAICGYPPEDLVLHAQFVQEIEKWLDVIAPATKGMMAVVGLVRKNVTQGEKKLYNSAAVFQEGQLIGFYDKCLLPTYDVFDERRYFEAGQEVRVWSWRGKKIGVLICEDVWEHAGFVGDTRYAHDPVMQLATQKPDILLNLSASPYHFQKPGMRVKVCQKAAATLQCPVVMCCQVGGNDQLVFDGYSVYVDRSGKLSQLAKGFEEDTLWIDSEAPAASCPFHYDALSDLCHALVLGTRDYFHKQGFKKAVLGLSGGIDSALVACITAEALGPKNVLAVAMPSRFSSEESIKDAAELAKNLGIAFNTIPIEEVYATYLKLLEPHFEGRPFDLTEENLQARIRGMVLMALSNKHGYLVVSTGNKSEMAMGFCTLYGDMAGGLAAIADVTKTQVYALARWINREREIIPRSSLEKEPSAELRPNQKDRDTLPDFGVIDAVIQGYVEEFLSPEEIAKKGDLSLNIVNELIRKIYWAEYKRRQAPPSIRVSKKSFRVGRRVPIVQGWMK
jgi:NAD+ synthase (glutamine-hydrolysing)